MNQNFFLVDHKLLKIFGDLNFLCNQNFLDAKCFWTPFLSEPKIFENPNFIRTQILFGPKFFLIQNIFATQNFLQLKIFETQKVLGPKIFQDPRFLRIKNFIRHNIFLHQKFHWTFFMIYNFSWPKIFHDPKFFMTWNFSWFMTPNFPEPKIFVTRYFLEPVISEFQQFWTHNFLSNSNPTWNPTWTNLDKLEQVGLGVDFVFPCHKKKN